MMIALLLPLKELIRRRKNENLSDVILVFRRERF